MDLYWRENLICPTEPEYIEMVNNSAFLRVLRLSPRLLNQLLPSQRLVDCSE